MNIDNFFSIINDYIKVSRTLMYEELNMKWVLNNINEPGYSEFIHKQSAIYYAKIRYENQKILKKIHIICEYLPNDIL